MKEYGNWNVWDENHTGTWKQTPISENEGGTMAYDIHIVIPGNPIAKKRPRFVRRGKFVQTYNPQETEEGKWLSQVMGQIHHDVLMGSVIMVFRFTFERPKCHYGTGKNAGKLKGSAPIWHTNKPDLDNCVKFVKDCLNGLAYHDDSQVWKIEAYKLWGEHGETEVGIIGE